MSLQTSDLEEFNNSATLKIVWEALAELAKKPNALDSNTYFTLTGTGEDSLCKLAFSKCSEAGVIPKNVLKYDYPPFWHIVLKVYYSALAMGLVLPSRLDQELNWNQHVGAFHFTYDGVLYFSEGFICIDDPDDLGSVLLALKSRLPVIEDGQIELLLEAQRCVKSGCNRAAMVLIGVACEDSCIALIDAIPLNCQAPSGKSAMMSDWKACINTSLAFSARWKSALRILEQIKKTIRKPSQGQTWWQWWELVPGSLYTLGEAVRVARNAAAHDTRRNFSKAEVALLLSAMPTQLEMIANLTGFFKTPPAEVVPIKI